jgi:hypothetical protein
MAHPGSIRDDVERLISRLPRLRHDYDPKTIAPSGLYFFFEDTEPQWQIVRVGTHRSDGGLPRRLRRHFKGTRRVSVFRRHLGSVVLFGDERLDRWMERKAEPMPDVEAEVSRILRDHFEFSVLFVGGMEERFQLEAALIGALARQPRMSPDWRGRCAARSAIRQTGLWNVERIDHAGPVDLNRLQELVDRTNSGNLGSRVS